MMRANVAMRQIIPFFLGAFLLGGCAQKIAESRLNSALLDAGLSQSNSECMAERMVDRLSISELRKLEELKPRAGEPTRPATIRQFVQRVSRVGDAKVLSVATSSAVICATQQGQ